MRRIVTHVLLLALALGRGINTAIFTVDYVVFVAPYRIPIPTNW